MKKNFKIMNTNTIPFAGLGRRMEDKFKKFFKSEQELAAARLHLTDEKIEQLVASVIGDYSKIQKLTIFSEKVQSENTPICIIQTQKGIKTTEIKNYLNGLRKEAISVPVLHNEWIDDKQKNIKDIIFAPDTNGEVFIFSPTSLNPKKLQMPATLQAGTLIFCKNIEHKEKFFEVVSGKINNQNRLSDEGGRVTVIIKTSLCKREKIIERTRKEIQNKRYPCVNCTDGSNKKVSVFAPERFMAMKQTGLFTYELVFDFGRECHDVHDMPYETEKLKEVAGAVA